MGEVTPFYADDWLTVYGGDCLDVMRALPAESVDCVVTSPPEPYWGLRDYGTATWVGGDDGCDHKNTNWPRGKDLGNSQGDRNMRTTPMREACGKCGATRVDSQLGLERTPEEYVANMVAVFAEVRRVLKPSGTCWLNLGDSYAGSWGANGRGEGTNSPRPDLEVKHGTNAPNRNPPGLKPKDLVGIPWRVAFALQADGWYLRSDIIWSKPNPMPESVTDRPTKSHEYLFLLTKSERYYFDADAVREDAISAGEIRGGGRKASTNGIHGGRADGQNLDRLGQLPTVAGRNIRSVWNIATRPYPGAHFAVFPPELPERCIKAGSSERGVCPECGAPWERVVERTNPTRTFGDPRLYRNQPTPTDARTTPGPGWGDKRAGDPVRETKGWKPPYVPPSELNRYGTGEAGVHRKVGGQYQKWLDEHPKQTVGWNGCTHVVDPVPAVILDPFAGSGTVGMVANRLSRRAILIDLNPEYLKQQMTRNSQVPLGLTEGDAA